MNPYVIGALALSILAAVIFGGVRCYDAGADASDAKWLKVENERAAASKMKLDVATQRYIDAEATNDNWRRGQETKDHERETQINGLRIANGRLIVAAGGLFDRNGRPAGGRGGDAAGTTAGSTGSTGDVQGTGCRLSDALTADLLDYARDNANTERVAQLGADYAAEVTRWRETHRPKLVHP